MVSTDGADRRFGETIAGQLTAVRMIIAQHSHGDSFRAPSRPDLIHELLHAGAYPHPVAGTVRLVETHISWVLLTGEFAYKIKKPVDLGFLDFRDLERRRFYCREELRLNRLWAPELYLDVVPVTVQNGHARIDGNGPAVDYAVRMRQFDQGLLLDRQLETGRLTAEDMLELAAEIASRHAAAERVGPPDRLLRATRKLMWENFDDLIGEAAHEACAALHRWTRKSLSTLDGSMKRRCEQGYYRQCHGDLHLGNLVRLAGLPRAFDCIEFSRELREIDVVADYAFLVMDLVARGRADLAYAFLNRYLEISGDYAGVALLPLYVVYRSLVRAKVASIRRRGRPAEEDRSEDTRTINHYCELAQAWAEPRQPLLVVMTGLSGSGKTWLSSRLVTTLPAVRVRSDLERKRLFHLAETADSHSGIARGIYQPGADTAVYERMFALAASMLAAGCSVILDAAFLDAGSREQGRRLAAECGAGFVIVLTAAALPVLGERVQRRAAGGGDASEANLAVLQHQLDTVQPLGGLELASTVSVQTDGAVDIDAIVGEIGRLGRPAVPPGGSGPPAGRHRGR